MNSRPLETLQTSQIYFWTNSDPSCRGDKAHCCVIAALNNAWLNIDKQLFSFLFFDTADQYGVHKCALLSSKFLSWSICVIVYTSSLDFDQSVLTACAKMFYERR